MISSKKIKSGRGGVPRAVQRRKHSSRQPDWDPTIHDLSSMRLSQREQAKRHEAHTSKNRVQIPDHNQNRQGQQRSAQHTSQSVSSFHEGSGIDLGAVARDLQAGQSGSDFGDNSTCQPNAGNDATISAKQQPDAVSEEASAGQADSKKAIGQASEYCAPHIDGTPKSEGALASTSGGQQSHRQHAEASDTLAPDHSRLTSAPSYRQASADLSPLEQRTVPASTSSPSNSERHQSDMQQQVGADASSAPQQSCDSSEPADRAGQDAQGGDHSVNAQPPMQQQLEAQLSMLTDRLHAAEQAAGNHDELQQQLQQLKQDKAALQADVKQFTEHISSMLTTLQSQVSKLLLTGPIHPRPAKQDAFQSPAEKHSSSQGSIRSALPQWNVESHGTAPSPLARHQIFESDVLQMPLSASAAPDALLTDAASRSPSASHPPTQPSAASANTMWTNTDDCIFDDEVGLPSFVQMTTAPSANPQQNPNFLPPQSHALQPRPPQSPDQPAQSWLEQVELPLPRPAQLQPSQADSSGVSHLQPLLSSSLQSITADPRVPHGGMCGVTTVHQQSGLRQVPLQTTSPSQGLQHRESFWHTAMHQQSGQEHLPLQSLSLQSQRLGLGQPAHQPLHRGIPKQHISRQFPAMGLPDFGSSPVNKPHACALLQRLGDAENRQPVWLQSSLSGQSKSASQDLKEVIMPHLRHRGLPHAPLPQNGDYQGPAGLRSKPMSVRQPLAAPVVNKHDSMAFSVWTAQ